MTVFLAWFLYDPNLMEGDFSGYTKNKIYAPLFKICARKSKFMIQFKAFMNAN